jgi:hypothetical protein
VTPQGVQGFKSLRLRHAFFLLTSCLSATHCPRTERERGRAPRPGPLSGRRRSGSRLRPGCPAALSVHRLRLLPSGPDRVHGSESRRTRPSTLLAGGWTRSISGRRRVISPACRGFPVQGTPSSPPSTTSPRIALRAPERARADSLLRRGRRYSPEFIPDCPCGGFSATESALAFSAFYARLLGSRW